MKHCDICNADYDTDEEKCPVCGGQLQDMTAVDTIGTEEIVSSMTITGIL